jgi:transcriptional regulator with XRE-family HTH domain
MSKPIPLSHAQKIDHHVGQRLRAARMLAGISQETAGKLVSLTFQQIQKYESGKNRIAPGRLQILATAFGKPIGWFYEDAPGATDVVVKPDLVGQILAAPHGVRLVEGLLAINNGQRAAIADLVSAMNVRASGAESASPLHR